MAMTIAVTRNVPTRFRGFLATCMIEIVPGVYLAPRLKKAVRERVWAVLLEWSELLDADSGIVLFWMNRNAPSGVEMRLIGWPQKELVDHEGFWLARRALTQAQNHDELTRLANLEPLIPAPQQDE